MQYTRWNNSQKIIWKEKLKNLLNEFKSQKSLNLKNLKIRVEIIINKCNTQE